MLTLPGSLLWLFLLVYFSSGQILDTSHVDRLEISTQVPLDTQVGNYSRVQNNEEEKENETKIVSGDDIENPLQQDFNQSNNIANKTSRVSEKPLGYNGTTERSSRRRLPVRTSNAFNATEIPMMSQERRNSYLSIAERRKYYNRTRVQTKKPQLHEVELEYQETTNKLITSSTETLLVNEIRVVKKPVPKESPKETITEQNPTHNQRLYVSSRSNETPGRLQSTRQSVIQSQYQFGQKLNLRKTGSRAQETQDERLKRKKEKSRAEVLENSTNKLKNYPTQSTKLIKVDKSLWGTTTTPKTDADHENLVMVSFRNGTVLEKLVDYVTANNTEEVFPNKTSDNISKENRNETTVPGISVGPLPLSNLNISEENIYRKTADEEKVSGVSENVHTKEISSINKTASENVFNSDEVAASSGNKNNTLRQTADTAKITKNSIPQNFTGRSTNGTFSNSRNGKFSNHGVIPTVRPNPPGERHRTTTPFVKAVSRSSAPPKFVQNETNFSVKAVPPTEIKKRILLPTVPTAKENNSKVEDYPLTIELNENNKRVLSEMFQKVTTPEPKRTKIDINRQLKPNEGSRNESSTNVTAKTTTTTTTTASTTPTTPVTTTPTNGLSPDTTTNPQPMPPEEYPEDHKAQGTRFNTKFYIAPNLNKSQVIKVVEEDDNEVEEDTDARSRSAGAAIYVLAAFGVIPLLLALVFGTKFAMQRNQRKYECESDAKSDLSANESQMKDGKKKKGSTDLKKSPSNVTTITLVTATRLPRVQHWENSEKQGSRNWEFPRSKLKLKTILGQGNFGQVWKAEVEDMVGHEGVTRLVAVKTVKEGATEKEHTEFIKELEIMQQIGSHPNIVTLLGCCTDQEPYYLIMEYVKLGKLLTYLREHRINENYYNFSNDSNALTSRDLTVFAYCVARGMEYLASRGIIHRDLAARNVLVDHNKLCKIADFGMSRSVRDFENGQVYEERQQKGALPIRWMAPESLVYSVFTYKSDVWSFGIVMWEIVTLGSTPYPNMGAREVMRRVRDGYRLERPSHCNPEFFRLISHCWAHDPNKRPDFSELRQELSCLLDNPTKDGSYVDLDRFAIDNSFHVSSKTNDFRLLERNDFKTLQKLGEWENKDWTEDVKKIRTKRGKNNGKGTVMLTGQGSFTVNSRILEKEFKII